MIKDSRESKNDFKKRFANLKCKRHLLWILRSLRSLKNDKISATRVSIPSLRGKSLIRRINPRISPRRHCDGFEKAKAIQNNQTRIALNSSLRDSATPNRSNPNHANPKFKCRVFWILRSLHSLRMTTLYTYFVILSA